MVAINRRASKCKTLNVTAPSRRRILQALIDAGETGLTCDELSRRFRVPPNHVSGRLSELQLGGVVIRTAQRRRTRAGKTAAVVVISPKYAEGKR